MEHESNDVTNGDADTAARVVQGVQIGSHNTQYIYNYSLVTEGVAPPPLITFSGQIESPYRGLRWFTDRDAPFFFGRDSSIDAVLQRLSRCVREPNILMLSGVSGAGKSSLLHAGVLPRIRGGGLPGAAQTHTWPCVVLKPGHQPFDELAWATAQLGLDAATVRRELREDPTGFALTVSQAVMGSTGSPSESGDRRLMLVVDQFEQLFTQCRDRAQQQAFVDALHAAATTAPSSHAPALVVLVVRADFEARCADYDQLTDAVQDRYLVTAMTERQLRLAITEPAKAAGSRVDDDLTEQLLREMRTPRSGAAGATLPEVSGAGVLPLLSDALDRAWRTRSGTELTLADYERTGGIESAVADSAQHTYNRLTPRRKDSARRIFTRLTITGADGTDTADRVERGDLAGSGDEIDDIDAVLEAFVAERLLTVGAGTVEISHEILLSTWPLLREWLADTHEIRTVCSRLRTTAEEWDRSRDSAYLYAGSILETAVATRDRIAADPARYPALDGLANEFLDLSIRADKRRTRLRGAFTALLLVLVVGLSAATITAFRASNESARQRDLAVARQLISQSERLATTDPFGSRLTALAAWRINPGAESRYAMLTAARNPRTAALSGHSGRALSMSFTPDGRTLATVDGGSEVRLWDVAGRRLTGVAFADPAQRALYKVVFSPDGKILATSDDLSQVRLWDVESRRPIGDEFFSGNGPLASLVFSPDGKILATSNESTVRLWDVASRTPIGPALTNSIDPKTYSVAFSPNGTTLATAGTDNTVRLWDVANRRLVDKPLTDHTGTVRSVAFSPDGTTLATTSDDTTIRLWDTASHQPLGKPLTGHTATVRSVAFSPDGTTLATTSDDTTIRLWDTASHQPLGAPLTDPTGPVDLAVFHPDGQTLATDSGDGKVWLWDIRGRRPIGGSIISQSAAPLSVVFSPTATTLAATDPSGKVQLWDVASRQPIGNPLADPTGSPIVSVTFSPNGETLATTSDGPRVLFWDVSSRPIGVLTSRIGSIRRAVFSPDGKTLATADYVGRLQLWDIASRQPIGKALGIQFSDSSVTFSPNGKTLAALGNGEVRLWDVASRQPLGNPLADPTGRAIWWITFSPDGTTLATTSDTGTVRLWDIAARRPDRDPFIDLSSSLEQVTFSPDGTLLAATSQTGTVRLWDIASRRPISDHITSFHNRFQDSLKFSSDGKTLATSDLNGKLWDVSAVVDVVSSLCAWANGSFDYDSWKRYVPDDTTYRPLCS
ncbi:hypothetical protein ACQP0C_21165 [Nocardia sp. CA-129566]|uniref:nSTAND1 domain-containing NTPase n=1 Tax=Nocardia sp. CA-129566 TaxID=3239976 RepID=UPI003D95D53B